MDVSTVFKRSYLRRQYRAAVAASTTLILQLESEQDTIVAKAERGQTIAGTSAKGHSVNYSVPGNGAPTQGEMTEVIEELITLYYQVDAISGVSTDDERLDEMLHRLKPVKTFRKSFTTMRLAAGGNPSVSE